MTAHAEFLRRVSIRLILINQRQKGLLRDLAGKDRPKLERAREALLAAI